MQKTVDIFSTTLARCQRCYQCIRRCPVKAIKLTESVLEIDPDRCIYCGACILACSQKAITLADGSGVVRKLLSAGPTVAVLAPEIDAAFPGISRGQIRTASRALGFYAVEDMVIAEEIVAAAYVDLLSRDADRPLVRSTCAAVVNYVEKYLPEMVEFLAPVAGPMVVQGRIIKALYAERPAVVFIGPCVAKKMEITRDSDRAVDAVITFSELGALFSEAGITLAEVVAEPDEGTAIDRTVSLPGGFPSSWLSRPRGANQLTVSRSISGAQETLAQLGVEPAGRGFIDLLSCRGCIDGPAFTCGSRASRVSAMAHRTIEAHAPLAYADLGQTPDIDMLQAFSARPVAAVKITAEQIKDSLAAAGLVDSAWYLDCSICGYGTCVDHARAVIAGFSDWSACFPCQRRFFSETTSRLKEASNTDSLTGLVNHRGFTEALSAEFHRYKRYHSQLSLIMIDVDGFKLINDTHGHLQGDRFLKLLAQLLTRNLREIDIASRHGGDEFAIILPQINKNEAETVAEKLRTKVMSTVFWLGDEIKETVSLSMGVSDVVEGDADPMALVNRADKALYKAKNAGRNQTVLADP